MALAHTGWAEARAWSSRLSATISCLRWRSRLLRWLVFAIVGVSLVLLTAYVAGRLAEKGIRDDLAIQAGAAADLHAALLRSELEKHRSLPFVLAEDRDVRAVLQDSSLAPALNARLEALSERTRVAVIYIVDAHGVTVAASNWRLPTSFVGSNYSFRPYFKNAILHGEAEHFLLGTVSLRPGLYLARRVEGPGVLGAVIVKVEFDGLEREWKKSGEPAFVTDRNGAVLVTNVPAWRFKSVIERTAAERARLNAILQFGDRALEPLPLLKRGSRDVEVTAGELAGRYIEATTGTATPGWTLHLLERSDRAITNAVLGARVTAVLVTFLLLIAVGMLLRRGERAAALTAANHAARQQLEVRVEERTAELRNANERLTCEIDERRRAEASLLAMQDSLAQSNKFATLGQIAAGVAHEINQPVAAIRTYADNAVVMIDRNQLSSSKQNMRVIASLTERIGLITDELREFSRKSRGRVEPTSVDDVIAGALLLTNWRARQERVDLRREPGPLGVSVQAERTRLEQVLVNLLQNALEAVAGQASPRIRIIVQNVGRKVRIVVADNGPGLAPQVKANLFTPFATTKPKGLGLGLIISRDIAAEFGGDLSFRPASDGGAEFTISLRRS